MKWLIDLLAKLIPELITKLFKKSPPTVEFGEGDGEFEESVREQIDDQIPDGPGGKK